MKNRKFWVALMALFLVAVMLISLIVTALPHAHAASSSEIKDQITEMEKEQEGMQAEIDALKGELDGLMEEWENLQMAIDEGI